MSQTMTQSMSQRVRKTARSRRAMKFVADVDVEGTWAVSYGDMVTLLLTFFILFFILNKNKDVRESLEYSLISGLKALQAPTSVGGSQTGPGGSAGLTGQAAGDEASGAKVRPVQDFIEKTLPTKFGGTLRKVGSKVIVEFPDISFFGSASVELTKNGRSAIEKFAAVYLPYSPKYTVMVRAYTDPVPLRKKPGSYVTDNLELSALRSVQAIRLLKDLGIPLHRMRIAGYGEKKIVDLTQAADLKSFADPLSRTIELVIEPERGDGMSEAPTEGQSKGNQSLRSENESDPDDEGVES